jgi:hypothetical protein
MNTTPSSRVRRLGVASALAALVLAGCGNGEASITPAGNSTSPKALSGICAAFTQRNNIVHCTELFPGKKSIRLPSDPSRTQRYGALKRGSPTFHTRVGDLPLADSLAREFRGDVKNAYANTVYLATISKNTVTKIKPVVNIEENAVLRANFAGRAMEGTISVRTRKGDYSSEATLPVRIEFASSPVRGKLTGKITNATRAVRGAKGSCLAALNRTKANPLVEGFTSKIAIVRVPSMHMAFDDQLVLEWTSAMSNMGQAYYPSIATLLGGDPLGRTWETSPHGVPWGGPAVNLRLVSGGGKAC